MVTAIDDITVSTIAIYILEFADFITKSLRDRQQ